MTSSGEASKMVIRLSYTSGTHEVREDYLVYTFDSFIADVGGYLGLLLGYSAYSVFNDLGELWRAKN